MNSGMPAVLRPYDPREAMSCQEAAKVANRSPETIRLWAARFDIGRMVVGRVEISRPALHMLLDGNGDALRDYLAGDRSGARVKPYMETVSGRSSVNKDAMDAHVGSGSL